MPTDRYRLGAAGRALHAPAILVALVLYAYARGNRSSRGIERACWEDVAYKMIANMRTPDHSTIAEFRRRHETEIEELFDDVLGLCREALGVGCDAAITRCRWPGRPAAGDRVRPVARLIKYGEQDRECRSPNAIDVWPP